jgi:hypothetical protein
VSKEPTRSVQRRIAAQRGLPAPDFSVPKELAELRERALLTDINNKNTQQAIDDLENHKLSSLFSYRYAYFLGAQAQLNKVLSDPSICVKAKDQTFRLTLDPEEEKAPLVKVLTQALKNGKWVKTVEKNEPGNVSNQNMD